MEKIKNALLCIVNIDTKLKTINNMETLKTKNAEKTMNLVATITQPETGTTFELSLENVSAELTLSQAVGTTVQRLADYLRLYKRNNSKLLDCRKDILISVAIIDEGERVEWISERVQQMFKFKYRPSANEKGVKRLACRIFDVVTFAGTPFKVVSHDKVS